MSAEHEGGVTPASEEDVRRAYEDNKLAQVLYHDWESGTYDAKWAIDFDERCATYAKDRFLGVVGEPLPAGEALPYRRALEIGAGTRFFSLNLRVAGVVDEVHVTDLSPGMVEVARRNAQELGFDVEGRVADAEHLPYDDDTFDVVVGHAVIHHIPDVELAFREMLRVLKPGGRFVIAGEPTRIGHAYARRLGHATWIATKAITHLPPLRERYARPKEELDESSRAAALEAVVDLHTFDPAELAATARAAGATEVRTHTEELTAALLGWPVRTIEAGVKEGALGMRWAMFAFSSWKRLSLIDEKVLSRVVPQKFFYNVGITGVKPR